MLKLLIKRNNSMFCLKSNVISLIDSTIQNRPRINSPVLLNSLLSYTLRKAYNNNHRRWFSNDEAWTNHNLNHELCRLSCVRSHLFSAWRGRIFKSCQSPNLLRTQVASSSAEKIRTRVKHNRKITFNWLRHLARVGWLLILLKCRRSFRRLRKLIV